MGIREAYLDFSKEEFDAWLERRNRRRSIMLRVGLVAVVVVNAVIVVFLAVWLVREFYGEGPWWTTTLVSALALYFYRLIWNYVSHWAGTPGYEDDE